MDCIIEVICVRILHKRAPPNHKSFSYFILPGSFSSIPFHIICHHHSRSHVCPVNVAHVLPRQSKLTPSTLHTYYHAQCQILIPQIHSTVAHLEDLLFRGEAVFPVLHSSLQLLDSRGRSSRFLLNSLLSGRGHQDLDIRFISLAEITGALHFCGVNPSFITVRSALFYSSSLIVSRRLGYDNDVLYAIK